EEKEKEEDGRDGRRKMRENKRRRRRKEGEDHSPLHCSCMHVQTFEQARSLAWEQFSSPTTNRFSPIHQGQICKIRVDHFLSIPPKLAKRFQPYNAFHSHHWKREEGGEEEGGGAG